MWIVNRSGLSLTLKWLVLVYVKRNIWVYPLIMQIFLAGINNKWYCVLNKTIWSISSDHIFLLHWVTADWLVQQLSVKFWHIFRFIELISLCHITDLHSVNIYLSSRLRTCKKKDSNNSLLPVAGACAWWAAHCVKTFNKNCI